MKPTEQFQIGDRVVYTREGVITEVAGYIWSEKIGGPPEISRYQLSCGINVRREYLSRP